MNGIPEDGLRSEGCAIELRDGKGKLGSPLHFSSCSGRLTMFDMVM